MFDFDELDPEQRFREAWGAVQIARPVHRSLFTFGETVLPYYLIRGEQPGKGVSVAQGEVRIDRPLIITPDADYGAFHSFFEEDEEDYVARFLLARTARFSNFRFANRRGEKRMISDSVEEAVAKLNRKLDQEEEETVAILTAPHRLGGVAVLRYAIERVMQSAPDNIQELRERGFLPE